MVASAWTASLSDRSVQKILNSSAFRRHFRSTAGAPREYSNAADWVPLTAHLIVDR
jgi:hypothetical protein